MKGPAKKLLQQVIQETMTSNVMRIQKIYRAKKAREVYNKRLNARNVIQKHVV